MYVIVYLCEIIQQNRFYGTHTFTASRAEFKLDLEFSQLLLSNIHINMELLLIKNELQISLNQK